MDYCGRLNRLYKQVLPRACILPRDHYILAERVCDSEELIQSHLGEKGKTANFSFASFKRTAPNYKTGTFLEKTFLVSLPRKTVPPKRARL